MWTMSSCQCTNIVTMFYILYLQTQKVCFHNSILRQNNKKPVILMSHTVLVMMKVNERVKWQNNDKILLTQGISVGHSN